MPSIIRLYFHADELLHEDADAEGDQGHAEADDEHLEEMLPEGQVAR